MTPQTQTQTTHKIIRALWYAWQLPELSRHQATLEQCDGAAAAAYEAIQGGAATLARAAVTPGAARDLLDLVYQFEPPAELLTGLKKRRAAQKETLADNFFAELGKIAVFAPDAGKGNFPAPPDRTNKKAAANGTVRTYYPTPDGVTVKEAPRFPRTWEICAREYYFRVRREVSKAHAEMGRGEPMVYHVFSDNATAVRFINARQKAIKRAKKNGDAKKPLVYQLYPHIAPDGAGEAIAIVSNAAETEGARPVPTDRTRAYHLFYDWLNTPPETHLNRHSQGFGQQWQGMKGDGRKRQIEKQTGQKLPPVQLVTDKLPDEIENRLGGDKFIPLDEIDGHIEVLNKMDCWKVRGGGSVDGAFRLLKQACTQLRDTRNNPKNQSPQVGYTNGPIDGEKSPPRCPIGDLQAYFGGGL